jgi:hypothetical protein
MILVHHDDCVQVGTRKVKTGTAVRRNGVRPLFMDGRPKFVSRADA